MTRVALGVAAVVAGLSGCASPARFVEKQSDFGVIAIPANTDSWPTYNRRAALALIEKHVGPGYEIVEEREVATGSVTTNDQKVNREETFNTQNFLLPAEKQTINTTTTTRDVTEWRIAYRKIPGYTPPTTGGPGGVQQTQYRPGAGVPGAGVRPAGGVVQPGAAYPAGGFPAGNCPDGNCPIR